MFVRPFTIGTIIGAALLSLGIASAQITSPPVDIAIKTAGSIDLPRFTLANESTSMATGTHALSWGMVFKQGAVPGGRGVTAMINGASTTTQLDCKNKWSDNSCKHGIISVIAPSIPANTNYKVSLALSTPSGSNVDLSALPGSGYTLSTTLLIKALQDTSDGSTYNINWMVELTNALNGSTCSYWRRGPVVNVRRQGFRDNGLGKLREALDHRIGEVRRPAVGAASGG